MNNLFSVFDPITGGGLPLNWIAASTATLCLRPLFWVAKSQVGKSLHLLQMYLTNEFKAVLGAHPMPGIILINVALFFLIWFNNFLGLAPYVFTSRRHLTFALALALPLWVGHVAYAWVKTPNPMFAHLVPLGRPGALAPFMVLIELVRSLIRPLTLAVRLAANIVAGHLLMVLLRTPITSSPSALVALILVALVALALLESAVATIQAYVFRILTVLYVNEVADGLNELSKTNIKI